MFLTVNKDVLTMLMTSLARDASALGSIEVEVEVEHLCFGDFFVNKSLFASTKVDFQYFRHIFV